MRIVHHICIIYIYNYRQPSKTILIIYLLNGQTIARSGRLQHRSDSKFGENIYWASGKTVNGQTPVQAWYDEVKDYKFSKNSGFSSNTGHFTQVVWKSSEKMGVGIANVQNQTFVVANYDPAGNMQGDYDKNVFP